MSNGTTYARCLFNIIQEWSDLDGNINEKVMVHLWMWAV